MSSTPIKRIGILTSGGDCPGLNAVIWGAVRAATTLGWEVVGFKDGYEGLLTGEHEVLDLANTRGIMPQGGTILGTTNKGHFVAKITDASSKPRVPAEIVEAARATLNRLGVEALICIGGDGSLTTALQLFDDGFKTVGVPKTIDNDLDATNMTFGFDSAVACVSHSLDRLRTTAASHKRVMITEVMGRHAGWIALHGGFAGEANIILLPEIKFNYDTIVDVLLKREKAGLLSTQIVVAEGASLGGEGAIYQDKSGKGEHRLGGIGERIANELSARLRTLIPGKDVRSCELGHLQRGGGPTTVDRILGTRYGVKAVDLIAKGEFGRMVSYMNDQITDVPIATAVKNLRTVKPDSQMVQMARAIGISFGD